MDEAYAYVVNYAHANGYRISGLPRVSYLDGVWNRFTVESDAMLQLIFPVWDSIPCLSALWITPEWVKMLYVN